MKASRVAAVTAIDFTGSLLILGRLLTECVLTLFSCQLYHVAHYIVLIFSTLELTTFFRELVMVEFFPRRYSLSHLGKSG